METLQWNTSRQAAAVGLPLAWQVGEFWNKHNLAFSMLADLLAYKQAMF